MQIYYALIYAKPGYQLGYVAPKVSKLPHPKNNLHIVNAAKTGNFDNITVLFFISLVSGCLTFTKKEKPN